MKKQLFFACAFAATASLANAGVIAVSGALTTTDPVYNRLSSATSLSGVGNAVAYDTYTFTADTAPYSVVIDATAGGTGSATGLDSYAFIYSTFNPATPLVGLVGADDDWVDPDGAGPISGFDGSQIPSSGSFGPGTTASVLTLTPGATYTVVVTAFDNATLATGLGPYTLTITGAVVPEPATASAMIAAGALLRRRRA